MTMEWLDGARLCDPALRTMPNIDLGQVTRHGAEMYLDMIFHHGFYHGDPHSGNLVVLPNGAIGLLDFGMVARLDEHLREAVEDMLMAIVMIRSNVARDAAGSLPGWTSRAQRRSGRVQSLCESTDRIV
jgi:predicted unusual protein kinase regulating ubiquinone biosynthesis (AarF/ABC1/UbiB family)